MLEIKMKIENFYEEYPYFWMECLKKTKNYVN